MKLNTMLAALALSVAAMPALAQGAGRFFVGLTEAERGPRELSARLETLIDAIRRIRSTAPPSRSCWRRSATRRSSGSRRESACWSSGLPG